MATKLSIRRSRELFANWLARRHPKLAARAAGFADDLGGLMADYSLGASTTPGPITQAEDNWWQSLVKNVSQSAPQLMATKMQLDLMKQNLKRAERGLPPIDSASIAPTVRVQADVPAEARQTAQWATYGIMAAIAIGAAKAFKLI